MLSVEGRIVRRGVTLSRLKLIYISIKGLTQPPSLFTSRDRA